MIQKIVPFQFGEPILLGAIASSIELPPPTDNTKSHGSFFFNKSNPRSTISTLGFGSTSSKCTTLIPSLFNNFLHDHKVAVMVHLEL